EDDGQGTAVAAADPGPPDLGVLAEGVGHDLGGGGGRGLRRDLVGGLGRRLDVSAHWSSLVAVLRTDLWAARPGRRRGAGRCPWSSGRRSTGCRTGPAARPRPSGPGAAPPPGRPRPGRRSGCAR